MMELFRLTDLPAQPVKKSEGMVPWIYKSARFPDKWESELSNLTEGDLVLMGAVSLCRNDCFWVESMDYMAKSVVKVHTDNSSNRSGYLRIWDPHRRIAWNVPKSAIEGIQPVGRR